MSFALYSPILPRKRLLRKAAVNCPGMQGTAQRAFYSLPSVDAPWLPNSAEL